VNTSQIYPVRKTEKPIVPLTVDYMVSSTFLLCGIKIHSGCTYQIYVNRWRESDKAKRMYNCEEALQGRLKHMLFSLLSKDVNQIKEGDLFVGYQSKGNGES
jgi:hypothetical protein